VRRAINLYVAAGTKIEFLTIGQCQHELLDEARDIAIRFDGALVALHAEHFVRNLHLHVLLDRNLAGQAVVLGRFTLVQKRGLSR